MAGYTSMGYSYDATGAITSTTRNGTTHYLTYGAQGHVSQLIPNRASGPWAVRYTYNGIGQRILKTDARTGIADLRIEHTLYSDEDATQVLGSYGNRRSADSAAPAGEKDSTEVIYLPTASGLLPIATQINGRLYAIHTDHLNTPRRLTNSQGQVAWQWLITGFGETSPTTGAGGYLQTGNGYTYSEAVTFNLRYPGQVWDEESQLSYNMSRYYDPATGRYIQADPIGLGGGWNRFAYVGGNPLSYTDSQGLASRYEKPPNPNKRPPPEHRVPSGERERNIGHQNAEEHSRQPKGQRGTRGARGARGFGPLLIWDLINMMCEEDPSLCGASPPIDQPCS